MATSYNRTQSAAGLTAVLGLTLQRAQPGVRMANAMGVFFDGIVGRITSWNEARRTYKVLSQLTAHELDDIGLNPGDIEQIARRGY